MKRKKCKCGCGGTTKTDNEWIQGHWIRVNNPMKGTIGKSHPSFKHGLFGHKLYGVWKNMKQRCYNPNWPKYKDYGGRGIKVCRKWRNNPKIFYDWAMSHGWEKGLQIDRKNNDQGYRPGNCRFVTHKVNLNNKRMQKNNTTGHIGVTFNKNANKYQAQLTINEKSKYIGIFSTAKEAAEAVNEYKQ